MQIVKRPHDRVDPFEPDSDFVHAEMDRLYDAVYNVGLHHRHGRKHPRASFEAACDLAIAALAEMKARPK